MSRRPQMIKLVEILILLTFAGLSRTVQNVDMNQTAEATIVDGTAGFVELSGSPVEGCRNEFLN